MIFIDLFELFYIGSGMEDNISDEEVLAVAKLHGWGGSIEDLPCACKKVSVANMDTVLQENVLLLCPHFSLPTPFYFLDYHV